MPEREYTDYAEWIAAGGDPTYGQGVGAVDSYQPTSPAVTTNWRKNRNQKPDRVMTDPVTGETIRVAEGSDWYWDEAQGWQVKPISMFSPTPTTPTAGPVDWPPPPTGGGGGGGGEWGYLTEPFTGKPPSWMSPTMLPAPEIKAPPPFSYKEFQAPTPDSIFADPSYGFRRDQGQRGIEQSAAGRGLLRTGGTLKDIADYNQNAASQEYSNIFGRAVDTHNVGLNQALGTYGVNWGVGRDVLDREIDIWGAKNTAITRDNEMMNQREFNNFLADFDIFEKNRRRTGDYLFAGAGLGD